MAEKCNVCGSPLVPHFPEVRDPLTGEKFAIERCRSCGLGHTIPQPRELGRYYATRYYGNRHGFTVRYCMKRRLGFVASAVTPAPGKRLLDIGCGDGSFLLAAREQGWEVRGTELNPEPAQRAGLEVTDDITTLQGQGEFDCITMWHTLEHMRDIPFMLSSARKLLKPEGRLLVAVPDFGGLQARLLRERWLHLDVPRHLYHFDMPSLDRALAGAGLTPLRHWHQEFEYDLLGWSQSVLNYLMPSPNVFFDALTGKEHGHGKATVACSLAAGSLLTALSLPALAVGTLARRGGSVIAVAARSDA